MIQPFIGSAAHQVCTQHSCHWRYYRISSTIIIAIVAGVTCFAFTATTVSAFSSHCLSFSTSRRRYEERQNFFGGEEMEICSSTLGKRWGTRFQAVVFCNNKDDEYLPTVEFSDVLSRRQTLSALFISSAALAYKPLIAASVEENESVSNESRAIQTPHATATNGIRSAGISLSSIALASEPNSFQESISGFVAGATLAAVKTLVKFPLDTATVRVQMPNSEYTIRDPLTLFDGCFNGISLTLLSNIPAGALFFGIKDAAKAALKNSDGSSTMPRWLATSLAVSAGMIPYWIVRNPSEVIKVRQQANIEGYGEGVSAIDAVKQTLRNSSDTDDKNKSNMPDLYTGYWENILYSLPADVIKFIAYESITEGRKNLSPVEGARAGALATAMSQLITTPLDVVRNRLMTGKNRSGSSLSEEEKNKGYIESLVALGTEEGLSGLFAGATPKIGKAILSGAIQFATYEETKQSMSRVIVPR
uniref:Mitochondrial carrier protein n=1 Tax=Pseudo-nitzschia australis TaxID=44445 RepID=A0A7S4AWP2_9STRA